MIAPHRRVISRLASVLMFVGLACSISLPLRAEVSIEGGADALRLEADGASLEDVLAALGASFNLRYHTSSALDGSVTGTYHGPLARVASRLLGDYDFIIKHSAESVEIFIFLRHAPDDTQIAASSNPQGLGVTSMPPLGIPQASSAAIANPRIGLR
jgi:hypothetical protein